LNYPATLVASPDSINGAGREYHTPGKEFSIAATAHFLRIIDANESLDSHWQHELNDLQGLITFKAKGDSWYVVSGVTTNGYVFYHKISTKGQNWAAFRIAATGRCEPTPMTTRSGFIRSPTAKPSRRNSGLLTTSNSTFAGQ